MKIFGNPTSRDERDFRLGVIMALCFWGSGAAGAPALLAIQQQASATLQDSRTQRALCREATEMANAAELGIREYALLRQKLPFIPVPPIVERIAISATAGLKSLQCSLCEGHEAKWPVKINLETITVTAPTKPKPSRDRSSPQKRADRHL